MNRKVVWNACYGGFGLSPLATKMFYELKHPGETIYFYERESDWETDKDIYTKIPEDKRFNNHYIWNTNIERHDPDLISIVEELGTEKASGRCARLKIEDIGEEHYHIDEYDGYESVITSLGDDYWK